MNQLKMIYFSVIGFMVTLFYFLILVLYRIIRTPFGLPKNDGFYHRIACYWGQTVFKITPGWSIEIEGKENIPAIGEACVVAANHESATDIFAVYFLGLQFRWLSKDTVFKIPMVGASMRWAGYISIKRGDKDSHKEALEQSAQCLQAGIPMLFFPEGTRSKTGRPKQFKIGAFKLAEECKVPILPVILSGAGRLMEKGTFIPKKAHLKIKILPRTYLADDESVADYAKRVQRLVAKEHATMTGIEYQDVYQSSDKSTELNPQGAQ